jgi:hypothetical protein
MSDSSLSASELRSRVEAAGVDTQTGTTAGYVRYDTDFSLGSIQIAFGEDTATYDESTFPGVIYPSADPSATIVVSGDGTVAVVDASDPDHAREALTDATATLSELLLVDDDTASETVVPAAEIPFTLDPPEVETLGHDDGEE